MSWEAESPRKFFRFKKVEFKTEFLVECFVQFLGRARLRVELALWSHIRVVVMEDPPPPGWLPPPHVMDGWGARPLR